MSTRCYIGIQDSNGAVRAIYSHSDGYPSHVGKILLEHYKDASKVNQLIDLGSISILGPEIGEKHPFSEHYRGAPHYDENPLYKGMTLAYGRDRNDPPEDIRPIEFLDVTEFLSGCDEEYTYLFDAEAETWQYRKGGGGLAPLTANAVKE